MFNPRCQVTGCFPPANSCSVFVTRNISLKEEPETNKLTQHTTWFGFVLVWFGLVWFGLVWFGLFWFGFLVWFGLVWFGLVWFGFGLVWFWVWFGLVWFGLVRFGCLSVCLSVHLSICLSICLSVSLSVCEVVSLSVCQSVRIFLSLFSFSSCLPLCSCSFGFLASLRLFPFPALPSLLLQHTPTHTKTHTPPPPPRGNTTHNMHNAHDTQHKPHTPPHTLPPRNTNTKFRSHVGSSLVHIPWSCRNLDRLGRCLVCLFDTRLCKLARAHNQSAFVRTLLRNGASLFIPQFDLQSRLWSQWCWHGCWPCSWWCWPRRQLRYLVAAFVLLSSGRVAVAVTRARWPCSAGAWPSPCALVRLRARDDGCLRRRGGERSCAQGSRVGVYGCWRDFHN